MEEVFHHVKIDRAELQKVKQLKLRREHRVETEEFIPFELSDGEAPAAQEARPKGTEPRAKGKPRPASPAKKKGSSEPPAKKIRIDTLLHRDMPWMDKKRRYSHSPAQRLHQEIVDFVNWMGPTEEERAARKSCIDRIEALVTQTWPEATLLVFGSISTQFYVPSSDIDLVIMSEGPEFGQKPPLRKLARLLQAANLAEEDSIQVVSKARVPIIKYIDRVTSYPIDISFNTVSGTESAGLVKKYSSRFPALRPLTLVLKQFLEMRGLNEVYTGGIGSYTVTCLVLSFLQTHPLVQAGLVRPHENLGVMLMDMLELYGKHFNYDQVGISVEPQAAGEYYFDKAERDWLNEARPGLLSVEDPQNPENDISKGSFSFHNVRQSFDHGANVLVAAMTEFERLLVDKSRGSTKVDPSEVSILASAVRLSDSILRHRQYVQKSTGNL